MRDRFREAGLDTAEIDARLLAQEAFGLDALRLVSREREMAPATGLESLEAFATRRLGGEPVARLLGRREFWGLDFALNAATLVPRPETEMLVAIGVTRLSGKGERLFLDLGTGSGAIAVALLREMPGTRAVATDISAEALEMARTNAERHGLADRVTFRHGEWYDALQGQERFDLIVSNPPYIASDVIPRLKPEVRDHDPARALDGGMDGLKAYRTIIAQAARRLKPGGSIAVEIGSTQGALVSKMMSVAGFSAVELSQDLAGLDRVVSGTHS